MLNGRPAITDFHCLLGRGCHTTQDAAGLLEQMDRHGIHRAVINTVDQFVAVFNQEGNDEIIRAVRARPDRFVGFAAVNPWYGQAGVAELRRCVDEGLRGLSLYTHLCGCFFTDRIVLDLVQQADRLGLPVYCHTGTPVYSLPLGLMELALEFPRTPFVMGSAGYADGWYDVIPAARNAANIFVETSYCPMQLIQSLLDEVGPDRIVFGSDTPGSSMASELLKIRLLGLEPLGCEQVLHGNAARLLKDRS